MEIKIKQVMSTSMFSDIKNVNPTGLCSHTLMYKFETKRLPSISTDDAQ